MRASGDLSSIVGLEKTLAFNLSGHVLHTLFWQNLSPDGGDRPEGDLAAAIDEGFGSFDGFKAHLTEATGTVQGSGWGALSWEPLGERLYIEQIYDHQGNVGQSGVILLVIGAGSTRSICSTRTASPSTSRDVEHHRLGRRAGPVRPRPRRRLRDLNPPLLEPA
jgi:hypothetical protein